MKPVPTGRAWGGNKKLKKNLLSTFPYAYPPFWCVRNESLASVEKSKQSRS